MLANLEELAEILLTEQVELKAGLREIPEQFGDCDVRIMRAARERRQASETGDPVAIADGGTTIRPPGSSESEAAEATAHASGCTNPAIALPAVALWRGRGRQLMNVQRVWGGCWRSQSGS